jgi:CheY-like chemotaxis protein
MDGIATTAALRKIKPNVKIIAASGLDQQEEEAARSLNAVAYIQKPFTIETLINTVHEVLSGKVRKAAA